MTTQDLSLQPGRETAPPDAIRRLRPGLSLPAPSTSAAAGVLDDELLFLLRDLLDAESPDERIEALDAAVVFGGRRPGPARA